MCAAHLSVSPRGCTATITLDDPYGRRQVAQAFTLGAKHLGVEGDVGHISGTLIKRHFCKGDFLGILDDESDELHQFSLKLFDNNGMVRSEIVDHEFHRGTGAWGKELNEGTLVYLDEVRVKEGYRHAGIGSWMFQQLLQSPHVGSYAFVFAWPTLIDSEPDLNSNRRRKEKTEQIIHFFRKNGFRRIGKTQFFGYSPDPDHPSRAVPMDGDAEGYWSPLDDPGEDENTSNIDPRDPEAMRQRDAARQAKYPVQCAIGDTSAQQYLVQAGVQAVNQNVLPIKDIILQLFGQNPDLIHVRDEHGMTPLHIAAGLGNDEAIEVLLSPELTAHSPPDLHRRDNTSGKTPLECLEGEISLTNDFTIAMLGIIPGGASDKQLRCAWLLRKAMGEDVGDFDGFKLKNKWGCTCGSCAEGWYSPRMSLRLRAAADITADVMRDMRPSFRRSYYDDVPLDPYGTDSLPKHLRAGITAGFYDAYRAIIEQIGAICAIQDRIPTSAAILDATRFTALMYYRKGGEAQYALEAVVSAAEEQSILGCGDFDSYADELENWRNTKPCSNDMNFGLLRARLGLQRVAAGGDFDSDDDEMMDEDEDEDDD